MLTSKQKELLLFINGRLQETGVPPSFDEMKEALELKSKSGIHRLIMALEERGFIRRLPHRARALEVIKLPEGLTESQRDNVRGFVPSVIEGGGRKLQPNVSSSLDSTAGFMSVPMMGRIAAGVPISAIQDHSENIPVPASYVDGGDHFALEVKGDSMIEAGIYDGDTVVIKRSDSADNGDIIVALVDNEEATLKRLRRRGASIALEAANPAYETRIFGPDRVAIQGKLVALLRRY